MDAKKLIPLSLMLIPLAVFSASDVKSFSGKQLVTNAAGEAVFQSVVSCVRFREPVTIARAQAGGDWCGVEVPGYCARTQIGAAQAVCSVGYFQAMRDGAPAPSALPSAQQATPVVAPAAPDPVESPAGDAAPASATASDAEALAMEKERLAIEQQRLELRRQALELQKEELELQRQREAQAARPAPAPQPSPATPAPAAGEATGSKEESLELKKQVLGM